MVLNVLNEIGAKVASYSWVNWYGENGDESCWVDVETFEKAEGVTFASGQALWVEGTDDTQIMQSAGAVSSLDVVTQLQYGNTLVGNGSPIEIDLQDVVCNDESSDAVVLNVLNEIGAKVASYSWVNWYGESGDESCWVDVETFEKAEGVKFAPGQGLWVEGTSDAQTITFPGVEL